MNINEITLFVAAKPQRKYLL